MRTAVIRLLGLAAILAVAGCCCGCEAQRERANPFVGPSGAAEEMPFGKLPSAVTPEASRG
jgi:hypothetical protein